MCTRRIEMFRRTCCLIADDRRRAGRDDSHHRFLVEQIDGATAEMVALLKRLNRILDGATRP